MHFLWRLHIHRIWYRGRLVLAMDVEACLVHVETLQSAVFANRSPRLCKAISATSNLEQKEIQLSPDSLIIWAREDLNLHDCSLDPKSSASAIPPLARVL